MTRERGIEIVWGEITAWSINYEYDYVGKRNLSGKEKHRQVFGKLKPTESLWFVEGTMDYVEWFWITRSALDYNENRLDIGDYKKK